MQPLSCCENAWMHKLMNGGKPPSETIRILFSAFTLVHTWSKGGRPIEHTIGTKRGRCHTRQAVQISPRTHHWHGTRIAELPAVAPNELPGLIQRMTQQLEVAADQPWMNLQNHPHLHKLLKVRVGLQRWQFHVHHKIMIRLTDLQVEAEFAARCLSVL
jgi:hypothetical protein